MPESPFRPEDQKQQKEADRQTASLGALAIVLLLVVLGLILVRVLQTKSKVEDCLMAGHRNCDAALVHH